MRKNILLTGPPGCGKTTAIRALVEALDVPAQGFFTGEVRGPWGRTGFSIETLDGRSGPLAVVGAGGSHRVGRYRVEVGKVEELAAASIFPRKGTVIVVDEIGKMECLSPAFVQAAEEALSSPNPVVGSIALAGHPFIERTRRRPDVIIIEVTSRNRDGLPLLLLQEVRRITEG